jgi:hypothetical protein
MRRVSILIFILFTLPFNAVSAQSSNAGIVQGLWYSQEKVFAGEKVRIYVAIRNNTGGDLKGIVEFFDGEKKLERQNVQALSGRIIESWTDWTPTYGSHNLKATIIRTELSRVGSSTKEIVVSSALAEDTLFVDYDTDKDGIGNTEDVNDDNDTFTDAEEKQNGTDPLVKNEVTVQTETSNDKEEVRDVAETDDEDDKRVTTQNSSAGLEQYLAPSRAETVLTSVTQYVDTAKQKVDNYRVARRDADKTRIDAEKQQGTNGGMTEGQTNEDGFGEVTRKDAGGTGINAGGFLDKAYALITTLFNSIYTFVLWTISFVLGHPMLVQLAILLGILFTILRLASKFGNRRKY